MEVNTDEMAFISRIPLKKYNIQVTTKSIPLIFIFKISRIKGANCLSKEASDIFMQGMTCERQDRGTAYRIKFQLYHLSSLTLHKLCFRALIVSTVKELIEKLPYSSDQNIKENPWRIKDAQVLNC